MLGYILRRLLSLCSVLLVVSVLVFVLMNLVPGGPFTLADRGYSGAALENLERKYGLDKPIHVRYLNYLTSALQLDFGNSFSVAGNPPVTELISRIWPVTFQLGLYTILLSFGLGITLGIVAAYYHNGIVDNLVTFIATSGHRGAKFHHRYLVPVDLRIPKWLGRGEQVDRRSDHRLTARPFFSWDYTSCLS